MSFNYEKHKNSDDHGSVWTSYSDLFLGLSIIFLLLYVTVSLRQGTDGIQQFYQNQKLSQQVEDLKQQIKVYETLKQNYLETSASKDEAENYEELMNKLDLLQEQAKEEKNQLQKQAMENDKKEKALNKYQQMIRNIINSNLIAKGRIKTRDEAIEIKDEQLALNQNEINQMEKTLAEKKTQLALGERKIQNMNQELSAKMKQLNNAYKAQKITKKKFEKEKLELQQQTESKISSLREQNDAVSRQLNQLNSKLAKTNSELAKASGELAKTNSELEKASGELQRKAGELAKTSGELAKTSGQLQATQSDLARIAQEKERIARMAGEKEKEFGGKISELNSKIKGTEAELAKARENLNARKKLANQIKANFAANGIKADVDPATGDVMLSFGDQYFDTDRAQLKPEMKHTLEKAIPVYSSSLFENKKIAEKISNVEIVGFASPTYQGKYIDPSSMKPSDRQAINYNLDLSYARAKAIFNHVFDQNKMSFKHQRELLPLVKVTGRSFLSQSDKRDPASEANKGFCDKNDCAKLQRVIIKFNLKD